VSEESLRRFLDRLASDTAFVEQLKANPEEALGEFDLSATERTALATNDEDGLRRLAGSDVSGFIASMGCPVFVPTLLGVGCAYDPRTNKAN
jgi:hypothetical protein